MFDERKVWEFLESRPFYNPEFMPLTSTASEIYTQYISSDPVVMEKYRVFEGTGSTKRHPRETEARRRIEVLNGLGTYAR